MTGSFKLNKEIFRYFLSGGKTSGDEFDRKYLEDNNLLDYKNMLSGGGERYTCKSGETEKIIGLFNGIEEKTGAPYYTMKSFLNFPFVDDDIDFVVTGGAFKSYILELESAGFYRKFDFSDIREPLKRHFRHKDYAVTPHLHREVSWNGIITCDREEVLENTVIKKIDGGSVRIPAPTYELLIAAGHFLFENYHFKMGDLLYIKHLLEKDIDYGRIDRIAVEYGYKKGIALFFSCLNGISDCYGLGLRTPAGYQKFYVDERRPFPYYIPYRELIPVYAENFSRGLKKRGIQDLPRKLFTFTLAGYLWKHVLPTTRQKRCLSRSQG